MIIDKEQFSGFKKAIAQLYAVTKNHTNIHVALDNTSKYLMVRNPEFDIYMASPAGFITDRIEVPLKILNAVLSQLVAPVDVAFMDKVLVWKTDKTVLKIAGRSYSTTADPPSISVKATFDDSILSEIFASGREIKSDPFLSGTHITLKHDSMLVATTDGKQLVVVESRASFRGIESPEYTGTAFISLDAAKALAILGEGLPANINLAGSHAIFVLGTDIILDARCKTTEFPNYKSYLERVMKTQYQVSSVNMAAALKRLRAVVDDDKTRTKLTFSGEEIDIALPNEVGKDVVPMVPLSHDATFDTIIESVDFQFHFLENTFSVLEGDVIIEIEDPYKAIRFINKSASNQRRVTILVQPLARIKQ
jgi:hypothetical protein